jgi:hypothetical protein
MATPNVAIRAVTAAVAAIVLVNMVELLSGYIDERPAWRGW